MDYEDLFETIKARMFLCNELTLQQCDHYAWLAINAMKRQQQGLPSIPSLTKGEATCLTLTN